MGNITFEKILKVSEIIMNFLILNIMWFSCTALGLVFFGWAPSTVALLTIVRDKIMNKEDSDYNIIKYFWKVYRKEFIKANILGSAILILFIMVSINKMNFELQTGIIFKLLTIISIIAKVIICTIPLYMFPLYVHYGMDLKQYFIKAITLFFGRPFVTCCIGLWTVLVLAIIRLMPGLIAIFGVSIYFYGIMAINYQFFMRNEERLKKTNEKIKSKNNMK